MSAACVPKSYCHWLAGFFFVDGMDRDDIYQEAALAAWLAPCGLERLAARRRVIELLRRSKRGGRPMFYELSEQVSTSADVVDIVATRERLRSVLAADLTELERSAIGRAARGEGCSSRPLDNALQRARKKLAA